MFHLLENVSDKPNCIFDIPREKRGEFVNHEQNLVAVVDVKIRRLLNLMSPSTLDTSISEKQTLHSFAP